MKDLKDKPFNGSKARVMTAYASYSFFYYLVDRIPVALRSDILRVIEFTTTWLGFPTSTAGGHFANFVGKIAVACLFYPKHLKCRTG